MRIAFAKERCSPYAQAIQDMERRGSAGKPEKKVEKKAGKATAQVRVQKLTPPPAQPQAKTAAAPDESFFRYHQVKKGETLASIAKRYKTDAQTLRELNDMALGDAIKPGDRLIVGQKP